MNTKRFIKADIQAGDDERTIIAAITTEDVDREGDVVIAAGLNAKEFLDSGGTVFNNHEYGTKDAVGKCLKIKRETGRVLAWTKFATRPANHPESAEWVPDTLLHLLKIEVINGFSIGFTAAEGGVRRAKQIDKEKYGLGCERVFNKTIMHEFSVAPLPCNPNALQQAAKNGLCSVAFAKSFGIEFSEADATDVTAAQTDRLTPRKKTIIFVRPKIEVAKTPDLGQIAREALLKKQGIITFTKAK